MKYKNTEVGERERETETTQTREKIRLGPPEAGILKKF
jgi:hypothetical protein